MEDGEKQPLLDNSRNAKSDGNMRLRTDDLKASEATVMDPAHVQPSTSGSNGQLVGNGVGHEEEQYTYEELTSGFTCPTCNGKGKIPRGREADLVALIPYNDARLKPRRTYLYVLSSILACSVVAGVLCAFFIPRPIYMSIESVTTQEAKINTTTSTMKLLLQTQFSVKNDNFIPAYGQNATVTAFWSEVIKGTNTTSLPVTIGVRQTTDQIYANVTVTFQESFLVNYCAGGSTTHMIYMQFVATLQFKLMSQNQQSTKTFYSAVKCAGLEF